MNYCAFAHLVCRISVLVSFAFGLGLMVTTLAGASERIIRFGIPEEGYPPYLMHVDEDINGIVGDVFVEIAKSLGYKADVVVLPEKRLLHQASLGKLDAVASALEWEDDTRTKFWTNGIISISDNLVTTKARRLNGNDLAALKGKHIALMHGYTYPSLENALKNGDLHPTRVKRFDSLLRMVDRGRVDYGILDQNVAKWVMREQDLKFAHGLHFVEPGFDEVQCRIILYPTKDWSSFVQEFNIALGALKAKGTWKKILDRYR